ncbi:hypothetical protein FGO68_gene5551 [Halteria grandinella]|uniref:Uncharacterized protein n=1 Tax=Halteria grandinella TaxID=5974 RepID=A0A8J8T046_HALGN|nr:hypothetical protein FGO68_gene5551 [Halteria grandinella]
MKKSIVLSLLCVVSFASNSHRQPYQSAAEYQYSQRQFIVDVPKTQQDADFLRFVDKFGKQYTSQTDFAFRREIYRRNMVLLEQARERIGKESTLVLGVTRFADQTPIEMQAQMKYKAPYGREANKRLDQETSVGAIPETFDWRANGAVTPAKDQNGCGASWAYATSSAIESKWFMLTNNLLTISSQQLVDCVPKTNPPNGCDATLSLADVSAYINEPDQNLETTQFYPDLGYSSSECRADPQQVAVTLQQYQIQSSANNLMIKTGIVNNGPLLAIAGVGLEFMFYQSGIMDLKNTYFLAYQPLLIIGYGKEGTTEYWIAKNSFGQLWGENGFIRVKLIEGGTDVLFLQESQFTYYA